MSEDCVLTDISTQFARNANPYAYSPVEKRERIDAPTGARIDTPTGCFK